MRQRKLKTFGGLYKIEGVGFFNYIFSSSASIWSGLNIEPSFLSSCICISLPMKPPSPVALLASLPVLACARAIETRQSESLCRCIPGDSCWPSVEKWDALNETIGGRLIATVPLATVCHDPNYDQAQCSSMQEQWNLPGIQYVHIRMIKQLLLTDEAA